MSRLLTMFVVFAVAVATAPALAQTTDVHGTWTVEFHDGKAFLQVRSSTPRDANGDRPWNGGDWSMGQSFPVEELSGLPANDQNLTAANVKFEMRREAGTLSFDGSFRDGRGLKAGSPPPTLTPVAARRSACARGGGAGSFV